MDFRSRSGQVVVFLAVILLAVVMLAGILVDLSRISTGESTAKSAVRSAAVSALADYSSRLKEGYGIFARTADDKELSEIVKSYVEKNLSCSGKGESPSQTLDLYGFRVEKVSVTPLFNLSENSVFRQQVLEYMKYRAPKELVEGFIDRLSAVREAGRMSAALDRKVKIDKLLGKIDKSQQRLKKNVDGAGAPGEIFINGFNSGGSWDAAFNRYNSIVEDISALNIRLDEVSESIDNIRSKLDSLDSKGLPDSTTDPGPDGVRDKLAGELEGLLEERSIVNDSISSSESILRSILDELRSSCENYKESNESALREVNSIAETGAKAEAAIRELQSYMDLNFKDTGLFSKDFADTTGNEIIHIKELILSGQKASEMLDGLFANTSVLSGLMSGLNSAVGAPGASDMAFGNTRGLPPEILDKAHDYKLIDYSYEKPDKGSKMDDPREGRARSAEELLMDLMTEDIDFRDKGIPAEDLPSHTKAAGTVNSDLAAEYKGDLGRVGEDIELYDEEGDFEENALGFMGNIGEAVSGDLRKLRDDIYINEYIMGVFKSSVPALKLSSGVKADTGFDGSDKSGKKTFYQGEVEYILHGNPSQNTNILMTKAQILLLRFGLDTLHVYTDAKKKEMATGIAAAVAGWWTGGAGIPIISNLVMCGWGMGEAVLDVRDIMDGKPVPIFKSKGDWKLDIGLSRGGAKTDARLNFSYYDYLRLFLLVMDENKKLDRMEDLIQLDLQIEDPAFRMSGCNTCIRVEAEISMKYLFLTQPFMPAGVKGPDGRHIYKVLVYKGY